MEDCEICRREASSEEPLGGWVLRTDRWSACVASGFEAPGWLFLELRRHSEGPMSIDEQEASELGPLLARLTGAIQATTGAERVYISVFGEVFPHFHLLVYPRMPSAPPEHRGPHLFLNRGDLVDATAAAATAARMKASLDS